MNSDLETLLQAATYSVQLSPPAIVAAPPTHAGQTPVPHIVSGGDSVQKPGLADLAVEMKKLVEISTATQAAHIGQPRPVAAGSSSQEPSMGETVLRTAAMVTGVGPLVGGLLKLFGSDQSEELPALQRFSAPASVSVEAGLTREREFSGTRYAQGGAPEALSRPSAGTSQPATIQVNIQAMDSQSFLDRQDDIARAVREAMLHSNSLNDVVLEL